MIVQFDEQNGERLTPERNRTGRLMLASPRYGQTVQEIPREHSFTKSCVIWLRTFKQRGHLAGSCVVRESVRVHDVIAPSKDART